MKLESRVKNKSQRFKAKACVVFLLCAGQLSSHVNISSAI